MNTLDLMLIRFHEVAPEFEKDGPLLGCKELDLFKAGYLAAIEDAKIQPCPKPECQECQEKEKDRDDERKA